MKRLPQTVFQLVNLFGRGVALKRSYKKWNGKKLTMAKNKKRTTCLSVFHIHAMRKT